MTLDWLNILVGAAGILAVQSASSGFPFLSRFAKNNPAAAPAVNAIEGVVTQVANVVKPGTVTVSPSQTQIQPLNTGLAPLLTLLGGALSHINDLTTLQSYLTQLHLTPLPATATTPTDDVSARLAKLEATLLPKA